jgi:hypothetical protein
MSGGGGKIGSHAKIVRMTRERIFIAFTSKGALFDVRQERRTFSVSRCFAMSERTTPAAHKVRSVHDRRASAAGRVLMTSPISELRVVRARVTRDFSAFVEIPRALAASRVENPSRSRI